MQHNSYDVNRKTRRKQKIHFLGYWKEREFSIYSIHEPFRIFLFEAKHVRLMFDFLKEIKPKQINYS